MAAWAIALRPQSFPIAAGPVLVGVALAGMDTPGVNLLVAMLALMASLLMQAITNLQNDVGFTERGGEQDGQRVGLPRATALGLLRPAQVRVAIVALAVLATVVGATLTWMQGWPVLAIGAASLLAAVAYMGGPRPVAYTPWGECTVMVFFGWVAVGGSHWLVAGHLSAPAMLAATACGALSSAALALNNLRDRAHDATIGRRTFAVVWGMHAAQQLYALCLLTPMLMTVALAFALHVPSLALPLLLVPRLWTLWRNFKQCPGGLAYNPLLLRTFRMVQAYSVLQAAGALLAWP